METIEIKPCGNCEFCVRGLSRCTQVDAHTCDECGEVQAEAFPADVVDGEDGFPRMAKQTCSQCLADFAEAWKVA